MEVFYNVMSLFSSKGRMGRTKYDVISSVIYVLIAVDVIFCLYFFKLHPSYLLLITCLLIGILLVSCLISIKIKRLHDVGVSGWFMLIPIYGWKLLMLRSDITPNKYDSDVLDIEIKDQTETIHTKDLILSSIIMFFVYMLGSLAAMFVIGVLVLHALTINGQFTFVPVLYGATFIIDILCLIFCLVVSRYYIERISTWMLYFFSIIVLLNVVTWVYVIMIAVKFFTVFMGGIDSV